MRLISKLKLVTCIVSVLLQFTQTQDLLIDLVPPDGKLDRQESSTNEESLFDQDSLSQEVPLASNIFQPLIQDNFGGNEVFEINGLKSAKRQMQAVATKVKNFTLTISGQKVVGSSIPLDQAWTANEPLVWINTTAYRIVSYQPDNSQNAKQSQYDVVSICQGIQKCVYNLTHDASITASTNDNTICLGTMCFSGDLETTRKEILSLAGATFMVAPQTLDQAWYSQDWIVWYNLTAYKLLLPIPNNAFSTVQYDIAQVTSLCLGAGNCTSNLRRLKAKPQVMNNTVVNIYGNFFIGEPTERLDEIMNVAGVPVWVKRLSLQEGWESNETIVWWKFTPFRFITALKNTNFITVSVPNSEIEMCINDTVCLEKVRKVTIIKQSDRTPTTICLKSACFDGEVTTPNSEIIAVDGLTIGVAKMDLSTAWNSNLTIVWLDLLTPYVFVENIPNNSFFTISSTIENMRLCADEIGCKIDLSRSTTDESICLDDACYDGTSVTYQITLLENQWVLLKNITFEEFWYSENINIYQRPYAYEYLQNIPEQTFSSVNLQKDGYQLWFGFLKGYQNVQQIDPSTVTEDIYYDCIDFPDNKTCYTGDSYKPEQEVLAVGEARVVCTPISLEEGWWSNDTILWVNSSYPCIFINSLPQIEFSTVQANLSTRAFSICTSSLVCYRQIEIKAANSPLKTQCLEDFCFFGVLDYNQFDILSINSQTIEVERVSLQQYWGADGDYMIFDYTEIYQLHQVYPADNTFSTKAKDFADLLKYCSDDQCYYNFTQVPEALDQSILKCLGDVCYTGDLDQAQHQVLLLQGDAQTVISVVTEIDFNTFWNSENSTRFLYNSQAYLLEQNVVYPLAANIWSTITVSPNELISCDDECYDYTAFVQVEDLTVTCQDNLDCFSGNEIDLKLANIEGSQSLLKSFDLEQQLAQIDVSQKVLISDDSSFWHQGAAYKFIQTVNPEILNDQEVLDFSNNSYSLVFSSSLRWNNLYIDSTGICFVQEICLNGEPDERKYEALMLGNEHLLVAQITVAAGLSNINKNVIWIGQDSPYEYIESIVEHYHTIQANFDDSQLQICMGEVCYQDLVEVAENAQECLGRLCFNGTVYSDANLLVFSTNSQYWKVQAITQEQSQDTNETYFYLGKDEIYQILNLINDFNETSSATNLSNVITADLSDVKLCYGSQECYNNIQQVDVEDPYVQNDTVKCWKDICYSGTLFNFEEPETPVEPDIPVEPVVSNLTLCIDDECIIVQQLKTEEALTTNETVFIVNNISYYPIDFADVSSDFADINSTLKETTICLKDDLKCYKPIQLTDKETAEGNESVKCWKDWCYEVGEAEGTDLSQNDTVTSNTTLCIEDDCFYVIELNEVDAITTTATVFRVNNISYYPIDFADNCTNPTITGFLNQSVICLEGDLNCFQPIEIVDEGLANDTVKCWRDEYCFVINGTYVVPDSPIIPDSIPTDENSTQNKTLCLDETCFQVYQLNDTEAINTNETIIYVNGTGYQPIDFAENISEPNVSAALFESYICLADDSECYVPLQVVDENTSTVDQIVKCWKSWCYIAQLYVPEITNDTWSDNSTSLCFDETNCFYVVKLSSLDALTTNESTFTVNDEYYLVTDFAQNVTEPNITANLTETIICLAGATECYKPTGLVPEEGASGDQQVQCLMGWCYIVEEPYNPIPDNTDNNSTEPQNPDENTTEPENPDENTTEPENPDEPLVIDNLTLCLDETCFQVYQLNDTEAINTNETIIYVNGTGYQPIDFAENISEPNVSAALIESYICLADDSECYVPLQVVDENTSTVDQIVKCWKSWCYIAQLYVPEITNDTWSDNSTSLCFDETNCFYVVKLSSLDALTTNESTFTVNDEYYLVTDFAQNVTEPNITANLTETIICLAGATECYKPTGLVPEEGASGDQQVQCLMGWCYIVEEPYNSTPDNTDNNSTEPQNPDENTTEPENPDENTTEPDIPDEPLVIDNLTLCLDETCFQVYQLNDTEAINTNETIIYVNGTGYQPIDFAENISEPNVSAALIESYICLADDSECYVPLQVVDENTSTVDQIVKCWKSWCYIAQLYVPEITNDTWNDNSTSLCFDETNCFYVVKLSSLDALTTNESTFTVNDEYYLVTDFAQNVTEPNITANLTETIICLAGATECYKPTGLVPEEGASGDQQVQCLMGWCYIVEEPYNSTPDNTDNNSTEPQNPDENTTEIVIPDDNSTDQNNETIDNNQNSSENLTLCLDSDCFTAIQLETVDAVNFNGTVFYVGQTFYQPLDFSESSTEPDVSGYLNQTVICLEGDLVCYIPIGLVDPETPTENQNVKCWKDWCYVVGEPFTFSQNNTDDTNTTQNLTLCFDYTSCFTVVEVENDEAFATNQTIFSFANKFYKPLQIAENFDEPNVSAVLNETVICLEGDLDCYIPIEVVSDNSTTGDRNVKCLLGWCYIVGDPYKSADNSTIDIDSNETEPKNLTLCLDNQCFTVLQIVGIDAFTTIETVFQVNGSYFIPLEFSETVAEPNFLAQLNETVICLKDDLNCYVPIEVVEDKNIEGLDLEKVKCWNDWCYLVGEPYNPIEPTPEQNTTLCFDDSSCFQVKELEAIEGLTTSATTFTFNKKIYEAIDFASDVSEPDVNAVLSETVICLEGDLNCYIPIEIVSENTDTTDKTVKCLWAWCYTVGEPYVFATDNTEPDIIPLPENQTLCLDETCFQVYQLNDTEAINTNETIIYVNGTGYQPIDFAENISEPNVSAALIESYICLADDSECYVPLQVVDENTSTVDQIVKCWKSWCYIAQLYVPEITNDTWSDNSTSLCFDETNCFYVVKLSSLDALTTNESTFTVNDEYYLVTDFAQNVTEPNITANLTETIICLAGATECYKPTGLVPEEGASGDQQVQCLMGWCYIVEGPYNPIPENTDNNSTEPQNPDDNSTEPVIPDENTTEPVIPDENSTEPVNPDENTTEPVVPDENSTEPVNPDENTTEPAISDENTTEPDIPDEPLVIDNLTLCLDETCFQVYQLNDTEAINTNETIIYVNGTGYQPIDFAENISEPNVSAALIESYICLADDSECYVPLQVVDENTSTVDQIVKCWKSWCYIAQLYVPEITNDTWSDNSTSLCFDETNCFYVVKLSSLDALTTNESTFTVNDEYYLVTDFAQNVTEPNITANLTETIICLAGATECYKPTGLVPEEGASGDQQVQCLMGWCYIVEGPYNPIPENTDNNSTEPQNPDDNSTEPVIPDENTTEPVIPDENSTEPVNPDENTTEPVVPDENSTEPVNPDEPLFVDNFTLCLDQTCFFVEELELVEAISTNKTVFLSNEQAYVPLDFAEGVNEPNATGVLTETVICLAGDDECYIPIELVNPETTTGDQKVKCWKDWCYVIGEPYTFNTPNNTNDTNTNDTETTQNQTLCFDENSCFTVQEIQAFEALTTTQTIFTYNNTYYKAIELAQSFTEVDVSANLTETVICLENDLNCYIPLEIVNENTDTVDKTVKCFWSWCYIVGDPFIPEQTQTDNNGTDDSNETDGNNQTANITLCLDENCFVVLIVEPEEAITTNATIFVVGNNTYLPLYRTDYVAQPNFTNALTDTQICLEGDLYCYYPVGLCDSEVTDDSLSTSESVPADDSLSTSESVPADDSLSTSESVPADDSEKIDDSDQANAPLSSDNSAEVVAYEFTTKYWQDFCYKVDKPIIPDIPDIITLYETLCFEDNTCFTVEKLNDSQSLLTNETILIFNGTNYLSLDYGKNETEPDIRAQLNETIICLANDLNCYKPNKAVSADDETTGGKDVKCLLNYCYYVDEPYVVPDETIDPVKPEEPVQDLLVCFDDQPPCLTVQEIDGTEAYTTNKSIMKWNDKNWLLTGTCDGDCYQALIDSGNKTGPDYNGNSSDSVFCFEEEVDCYVPQERKQPSDAETDTNIKCFQDFCFLTTSPVDNSTDSSDDTNDTLRNNLTLCLDGSCFIVQNLTYYEALKTNSTVFVVENVTYVPFEFAEEVTQIDIQANLTQVTICPEGELICYIPTGLVGENTTTIDNIKCWKDWCFTIEASTPETDGGDENNTDNQNETVNESGVLNQTMCLDAKCFYVLEVQDIQAITTADTIFYYNETGYKPLDFAGEVSEPDIQTQLNETVICLENDLNCYIPIREVGDETDGSLNAKCWNGWCYYVDSPYSKDSNNSTENITISIDNKCFITKKLEVSEALVTNATIFSVKNENYEPLDFCVDGTESNITVPINETIICLEGDLNCYVPLFVVGDDSVIGSLKVKCLLGWCYAVNDTFDADTVKVLKTNNFPAVLDQYFGADLSGQNNVEVIHFHDINETVVMERVPLEEARQSFEPILWASSGQYRFLGPASEDDKVTQNDNFQDVVQCFSPDSCFSNFIKLSHSSKNYDSEMDHDQTVLCLGATCYTAKHYNNDMTVINFNGISIIMKTIETQPNYNISQSATLTYQEYTYLIIRAENNSNYKTEEIDLSQAVICFYGQVCYTNFAEFDLTDPSVPLQSAANLNSKLYTADILNGTDYTVCITLAPEVQMCGLANAVGDDANATFEDPIFYFNGLDSQGYKFVTYLTNDSSIVYPDLVVPLELLIEENENDTYLTIEIVDKDAIVRDNQRLDCEEEFCWLYSPYDANQSALSEEIISEETKSNDSSEDLVPSTPSDEAPSEDLVPSTPSDEAPSEDLVPSTPSDEVPSEDLVPSTPSDEVTSSEKGKPIKKNEITSYYDAQTSIDISKQFDDSSAVKLDLVVLIDDNSTKSEELKAERIRLNFRDYFHYAISSKNQNSMVVGQCDPLCNKLQNFCCASVSASAPSGLKVSDNICMLEQAIENQLTLDDTEYKVNCQKQSSSGLLLKMGITISSLVLIAFTF